MSPRSEAQAPSSKRAKVSVLTAIQPPAQTLDVDRYPTPVSSTETSDKRRIHSSDRQMHGPRREGRKWTRIRPPSPHPGQLKPALLTPPLTPSVTSEFTMPPLPPKPDFTVRCPLDLDNSRQSIYTPSLRRDTPLRHTRGSRLREVQLVIESDYEADVD